MAINKAYTDLEQSKKLTKILPLESADIYWSRCTITDFDDDVLKVSYAVEPCNISQFRNTKEDIPCWSLAALLGILPEYNLQRTDWGNKTEYKILVTIDEDNYASKNYDNPVDACYEMILKLHEMKML